MRTYQVFNKLSNQLAMIGSTKIVGPYISETVKVKVSLNTWKMTFDTKINSFCKILALPIINYLIYTMDYNVTPTM